MLLCSVTSRWILLDRVFGILNGLLNLICRAAIFHLCKAAADRRLLLAPLCFAVSHFRLVARAA